MIIVFKNKHELAPISFKALKSDEILTPKLHGFNIVIPNPSYLEVLTKAKL